MTIDFAMLTKEEIARRIAAGPEILTDGPYPADLLDEPLRPASVLIPLLYWESMWHILYIRRAEHDQDRHSGQVAFPGGGAHKGDLGPESTALREAYEEIGLKPKDVEILGRLSEFVTISSYIVTPVVGVIPWPYPLTLASDEVSRAFTIPMDWLADPENYLIQNRLLPAPYLPIPVIYFKPYNGEVLWGASARFTLGLIEMLSAAD